MYSDLNCYDESSLPSGKVTPIAVVFDTENRLAIGLKDAGAMHWMKLGLCGTGGVECNIEGIPDIPLGSSLIQYITSYGWWGNFEPETILNATDNGKNNTKAVIDLGGDYALSDYAPGYCYYSTEGGQKEGSWFLPSAKESMKIVENGVKINEILTNIGDAFSNNFYYTSSEATDGSYYRTISFTSASSMIKSGVPKNTYKDGVETSSPSTYVRCAIQY